MYEKSTEYFTKAIKLNPTNPFLFYQRGKAYYKICSYDKAIKDFTKAIRIKEDAELYYRRGFCYYEMKLYNQAIKDFSKAIKLNPNDSF
jgi:Tetratricopeptide repeat.